MDYIPPNSVEIEGEGFESIDLGEVEFQGNPWTVVYSLLFLSILFLGSQLVHKRVVTEGYDTQQMEVAIAGQDESQLVSTPTIDDATKASKVTKTVSNPKSIIIAVKPTDNLGKIFKSVGLSTKAALEIADFKQAKILNGMRPGKNLSLTIDSNSNLQELTYEINPLDTLIVTPSNDGWNVETKHIDPVVKTRYASSKVNGSIYTSARNAGVPLGLITQFMHLLESQINVHRIRGSDRFALFYKEFTTPDGKKAQSSELTAAELVHNGKTHRIVRFADPGGHVDFYTPEGHSVKPSFARYPLEFRRVASKFSLNRRHPILGIIRPHRGVDFSASRGTPVKATSKGSIEFASRSGGYGNLIRLKNGKYTTVYAHLSRFAKGVSVGKYVNQGDVIGYVGSSGLSTSSHLHYEFRINGKPYDPLSVNLPVGEIIASKYRSKFFAMSKKVFAQLDLYNQNHKVLAMSEGDKPKVN